MLAWTGVVSYAFIFASASEHTVQGTKKAIIKYLVIRIKLVKISKKKKKIKTTRNAPSNALSSPMLFSH